MYGDPSEPDPAVRARTVEMAQYSRAWHFDPYHQRLGFARDLAPAEVAADTEWSSWEVFQQARRGEHHVHVGTVHAPDAELALVLAKESFARRGECVNLWAVPARAIAATAYEDADVFVHTTDKSYREPSGFQGLRKSVHHSRDEEAEGAGGEP